ncbi:MAG: hypothetical protein LBT45_00105 [Rickettsiales bacterium]|nr:hypothetical protein [Rickettsiales bacterium]
MSEANRLYLRNYIACTFCRCSNKVFACRIERPYSRLRGNDKKNAGITRDACLYYLDSGVPALRRDAGMTGACSAVHSYHKILQIVSKNDTILM